MTSPAPRQWTSPTAARFAPPIRLAAEPVGRGVRLTRRGRVLVVLTVAVLLVVAFSLGRVASSASTSDERGPALQQTTVHQGDTLWSVARRVAPGNDPRQVIAQIRRINHLQGSSLQAGQQLLLPRA